MNFEEQIQVFKRMGILLNEFDYERNSITDLVEFIVEVETQLWRARIKIERKLNGK